MKTMQFHYGELFLLINGLVYMQKNNKDVIMMYESQRYPDWTTIRKLQEENKSIEELISKLRTDGIDD